MKENDPIYSQPLKEKNLSKQLYDLANKAIQSGAPSIQSDLEKLIKNYSNSNSKIKFDRGLTDLINKQQSAETPNLPNNDLTTQTKILGKLKEFQKIYDQKMMLQKKSLEDKTIRALPLKKILKLTPEQRHALPPEARKKFAEEVHMLSPEDRRNLQTIENEYLLNKQDASLKAIKNTPNPSKTTQPKQSVREKWNGLVSTLSNLNEDRKAVNKGKSLVKELASNTKKSKQEIQTDLAEIFQINSDDSKKILKTLGKFEAQIVTDEYNNAKPLLNRPQQANGISKF